jgi:hypothetical protein
MFLMIFLTTSSLATYYLHDRMRKHYNENFEGAVARRITLDEARRVIRTSAEGSLGEVMITFGFDGWPSCAACATMATVVCRLL